MLLLLAGTLALHKGLAGEVPNRCVGLAELSMCSTRKNGNRNHIIGVDHGVACVLSANAFGRGVPPKRVLPHGL